MRHLRSPSAASSPRNAERSLARLWREDAVGTLFSCALIAGLAWAPFWLGSNRALPWAVNGLFFPGLALCYEVSLLIRRRPHPFALRRIWPSAILFSFALAGIALQTLTSVPSVVAHPVWAITAGDLQLPVAVSISVNRGATLIALMRLLTDASLFWLALQLSRRAGAAELLIWGVSLIVAAYAAYGLLLTTFFSGAIPFFDESPVPNSVRASFVNRNHFATYAGLGLVATTGLVLRLYHEALPGDAGSIAARLTKFLEIGGARGGILLTLAGVTSVALLGSASRGGLLAALIGLSALFILAVLRRGRLALEDLGPALIVGCAIAVGLVFFGDILAHRVASSGLGDPGRASAYWIIIKSIFERPWLGFGYGTFADVFPLYRDYWFRGIEQWDKAHNTYLETWQGLGLLFGSALIIALVALPIKCCKGALQRQREATPALVAFAASALIGAHALVDFSVQIQAVALTFMALLGAGVAQSESSRHTTED